jgi:hypothetical protein
MMLIDAGVVVYIRVSARRESYLACSSPPSECPTTDALPGTRVLHKESYYVPFRVIFG